MAGLLLLFLGMVLVVGCFLKETTACEKPLFTDAVFVLSTFFIQAPYTSYDQA